MSQEKFPFFFFYTYNRHIKDDWVISPVVSQSQRQSVCV